MMTSFSPDDPWIDVGIRGRAGILALLYNRPARQLVAHLEQPGSSSRWVRSLYHRDVLGISYSLVPGSGDDFNHESPVSCNDDPFVFFLVLRARQGGDGSGGFDWESISKLALPSGEVSQVLSRLELPEACIRAWVSSILRVAPDLKYVTGVVGLELPIDGATSRIEYWLADIELGTGEIEGIAKLPTPFL